jgi:hypothetical protein
MAALDLEAYARLRAQLAQDGVDRDALLAQHGLDEDSWDALDDRFQAELSRALDSDDDGVPDAVLRYTNAFCETQRDAPGRLLSLEQFAQATRAVRGANDPRLALEKLGVTMTEFLKANQHWSPKLGHDPKLAAQFTAGLTGKKM